MTQKDRISSPTYCSPEVDLWHSTNTALNMDPRRREFNSQILLGYQSPLSSSAVWERRRSDLVFSRGLRLDTGLRVHVRSDQGRGGRSSSRSTGCLTSRDIHRATGAAGSLGGRWVERKKGRWLSGDGVGRGGEKGRKGKGENESENER